MKFSISARDTKTHARTGTLRTDHGIISTPIFMPVGTAATVKAIHQHELEKEINADIILSNTYHLYLRPGIEILQQAGGIHKFMGWNRPVLTDSGGYQIYSLSSIRKISEKGATFTSHIDGSKHFFSPEDATEIQINIGADIIMAFDECTPYPCEYKYAKLSMDRTHRWLQRCMDAFNRSNKKYGHEQTLAPIVQGSTFSELRRISAETISDKNCLINAIGGLSVGEPEEDLYKMTELVCGILPQDKPRYLMGVGTPQNLLECIALGVDMFDCVLPTRNARHGLLYTSKGIINIKNKKWENDFTPIDEDISCKTSHQHSKAYLRHLFKANEYLGGQIASLHNLCFYMELVKEAREKIRENTFLEWKNTIRSNLSNRL